MAEFSSLAKRALQLDNEIMSLEDSINAIGGSPELENKLRQLKAERDVYSFKKSPVDKIVGRSSMKMPQMSTPVNESSFSPRKIEPVKPKPIVPRETPILPKENVDAGYGLSGGMLPSSMDSLNKSLGSVDAETAESLKKIQDLQNQKEAIKSGEQVSESEEAEVEPQVEQVDEVAAKVQPQTMSELERLQAEAKEQRKLANWSKAAYSLSSAFSDNLVLPSQQEVDRMNKIYEGSANEAERDIANYKERVAFRENEANSPLSREARRLFKDKFNYELPEDISAADINKTFGKVIVDEAKMRLEAENAKVGRELQVKQLEQQAALQRESQDARREENALRRQENLLRHQENLALRQDENRRRGDQYAMNQAKSYQDKVLEINKKQREVQDGIREATALVASANKENKVSANALGAKLARALGDVGPLSDTDVERYIGRKDVSGKLKDLYNSWRRGRPSNETLEYVSDLLVILEKRSQEVQNQRVKGVANLFSRNVNEFSGNRDMTPERAYRLLSMEDDTNPDSTKKQDVIMRDKDGKAYRIPEDQVASAEKDGLVRD